MSLTTTSRSAIETFQRCRRKGYYTYAYGGLGYDRPFNRDLAIGLTLHKGMEVLLSSGEILDAVEAARAEWLEVLGSTTETAALRADYNVAEALLLGWYRVRYEAFLEEYEIISLEKEVRATLAPNLILAARADAVVRERVTGHVYIFNWKTCSEKKDWTQKWSNEIQAWTEALVVEEALGEKVIGCIFEGFYKGSTYDGLYTSPLVRAFHHEEKSLYSWEIERAKGWKRISPAHHRFPFGEGLAAWIGFLPPEVVSAHFLRSAPIIKNDETVRAFIKQKVRFFTDAQRMLEPDVNEEDRLAFFEQEWGFLCRGCPFLRTCHGEVTIEEQVEQGFLTQRVDHHALPEE